MFGVDSDKSVFHVVGADAAATVIQRVRFRRDSLLACFEQAERWRAGMESCPGSRWLARKPRRGLRPWLLPTLALATLWRWKCCSGHSREKVAPTEAPTMRCLKFALQEFTDGVWIRSWANQPLD